jgi:deoxyadenosine/deoxycytidine kinase
VDDNPYLNDFYNDMQRWSFNLQIFFLNSRFNQILDIRKSGKTVIQDRTIYEDAEIFAMNLYHQGMLGGRDYTAYYELYSVLTEFLPAPDLVVYLRASVPTLVKRIQNRARAYERQISADYLAQLNVLYEEWIARFSLCPVLTVPADALDYVSNTSHMDLVVSKVLDKLMGKEEVVFDGEYNQG